MRIIGITGGMGTGKTTAAKYFAMLGAKLIDADKIVHQLLKGGGPCSIKIIKVFGNGVKRGKSIDRKKLAKIAFEKKADLKKLESIVHPHVRRQIAKRIADLKKKHRDPIIILDVPLLFETKMNQLADATIVVSANQNTQIKRAAKKLKIEKQEALKRIRAQMPLKSKIQKADFIIDNNGSLTDIKKQVKLIWEKL